MPRGGWLSYLRPQARAEMPSGLRFIVGAVSGAALSLSYHGLYLSIYSWVCVGILLFALFGARPRVAFACGFLHALLFVLTSVPWIATVLTAHGGLSVAGGWGVLLASARRLSG
jgi:apolipoprotein N-acyltransferase